VEEPIYEEVRHNENLWDSGDAGAGHPKEMPLYVNKINDLQQGCSQYGSTKGMAQ
jgi:hypothetical protein